MKKTLSIILIIVLITGITAMLFSCATTARWSEQKKDTSGTQADVTKVNGSEKYIVFAALNSAGNLITHPAEGEPEATAAYAVVGYTGTVAELVIPAQYNGLNVTKVLVASPYSDYYCYRDLAANGTPITYSQDDARLANNIVVKSIVFGSNVTFIGAGVCAGMVNLQEIKFTSSSAVVLGHAAFSACNSLSTVTDNWTPASGATPFLASGYTPS